MIYFPGIEFVKTVSYKKICLLLKLTKMLLLSLNSTKYFIILFYNELYKLKSCTHAFK